MQKLLTNAQQPPSCIQLGHGPIPALPLTRQAPSVLDVAKQVTLVMTANTGSHMLWQHVACLAKEEEGASDEDHPKEGDPEENSLLNGVQQDDVPLEGTSTSMT